MFIQPVGSFRSMLRLTACCLLLSAAVRAADTVEQPGQADLDAAIDAKLSVAQLDDYAKVLDLCRQALQKGLDDESKRFAEDLYTGTLVDRAGMLVEAIFAARTPDEQWPRMRAFAMRDLEEIVKRDPQGGRARLGIARRFAVPAASPCWSSTVSTRLGKTCRSPPKRTPMTPRSSRPWGWPA